MSDVDRPRRRWSAPLTAAGLLGYSVLLHAGSFGLGLNSDAYELLKPIHTSGLVGALEWSGNYHFMPVTMIWLWVQHLVFGLHEPAYQVMNLVQHGVIVVMAWGLAVELTGRRTVAVIAAVLFSGASGFHEVLYWSVVGNNYHVSTFFYLLGLWAFVRYLKSDARGFLVLFWVSVGCALLSHELTLSLAPVCVGYYLLVHVPGDDRPGFWVSWGSLEVWRRLGRLLIVPGVLIGAFLAMKAAMSLSARMVGEPNSLFGSVDLVIRGVVSAVTMSQHSGGLSFLVASFLDPPLVWVSLVFGGLLSVVLFLGVFGRLERFLTLWLLVQLVLTQLVIGISSRHLYLPTVAGAILTASLLVRTVDWLAARRRFREHPAVRAALVAGAGAAAGFALVVLPHSDCLEAQRLWFEADRANLSLRATVTEALATAAERPTLYVLDATRYTSRRGLLAWTFQNGLQSGLEMHFPGRFGRIRIAHTRPSENVANDSRLIHPGDVESVLAQGPAVVVVAFVPERNGFAHLIAPVTEDGPARSGGAAPPPAVCTPESSPHLPWIEGAWPWLNIQPKAELAFSLGAARGAGARLVVFYLEERDREVVVEVEGETVGSLAGSPEQAAAWTHAVLPLPETYGGTRGVVSGRLRSVGRIPANVGRIGLLAPQRTYDAMSAPALHWEPDGSLAIRPGHQLSLPVAGCGGESCSLLVTFLEGGGRRLTVSSEGERLLEMSARDGAVGWHTASAPIAVGDTTITLRPGGREAARILKLESVASP